jgi:esterase/lipase superfamily enzyme
MYMISSRRKFWSPDHSTSGPEVIAPVDLSSGLVGKGNYGSLCEEVKGKRILLLVHGYNCGAKGVRETYALIEEMARKFLPAGNGRGYNQVVGYAWPGGDHVYEYGSARRRSKKAGLALKRCIQELSGSSQAGLIDVMAHSMGARVALNALKGQKSRLVGDLCLMAAAVDDDSLSHKGKFRSSCRACERVWVFHSRGDKVLKTAYQIGDWSKALGRRGPKASANLPGNVFSVDCTPLSHGDYKRTNGLYQFMQTYCGSDPQNRSLVL